VVSDVVGRHAIALATVRELAVRAGALRVVLLVDEGGSADATMVEWAQDGTLELTEAGITEAIAPAAIAQVAPAALPDVVAVPSTALTVDPDTGELAAPLGALAGLAEAVVALAAAFGGRSVATAEFATREHERPLMLAARTGEPVIAQLGGETFAFPEGWP
jgi:hypothetical protein